MPSVESSCPSAICLVESQRRKCTGMHCSMQDGRTPWSCPLLPVLRHYTAGNERTFMFQVLCLCLSLCLPALPACFHRWRRDRAVQTRMNQTDKRSDYKPGARCRETTENCTAVWVLGSLVNISTHILLHLSFCCLVLAQPMCNNAPNMHTHVK